MRTLRVVAAAVGLLLTVTIPNAHADVVVRNPATPSYDVDLVAGPHGHSWTGTESISFTNADASPLDTIWVRLWSNGVLGCHARAIVVSDVTGGTSGALSQHCTAFPITLDTPVDPAASSSISMHVAITLPARNDRFGYHHGLSLLGTALPTLAVHDDMGWHLPPFIDLGESFYSVVGDYTVKLTSPAALDTPASGVLTRLVRHADGTQTRTYVASQVRDFEWAAGRLERRAAPAAGGTTVRVWFQPSGIKVAKANEMLVDAVASMDRFSKSFGEFPYPEMDVVLTAFGSFGGMEYPTIVFTNANKITLAHELSHQWWYGIVGDDQYTEPWLDESFATWSEFLPYDPWTNCGKPSFPSDTARLTNDMGYWNAHPDEYGVIYGTGGCMLARLAHLFGLTRFTGILRGYAAAHRLDVARTEDFQQAIESAAATDLPGWDAQVFWSEWRVGPP